MSTTFSQVIGFFFFLSDSQVIVDKLISDLI